MANTIQHRGPDGQGFFVNGRQPEYSSITLEGFHSIEGNGNVGLAHRRLSIIDLKSGRQPLCNEDGTIWVTYNGEIYNFRTLKRELLQRGHQFKTDCDTEVIVHGYEEWGEGCVDHFRGMFAFGIWNSNNDTLFLVRDRLGIKPLYYHLDKEKIIFGSEIKAILAAGDIPRKLNEQALSDYFNLLYIPAPKSIFETIKKLPAGHTITIKKGKPSEPRQYWDLSFAKINSTLSEEEWCEKIITKLEESTQLRMLSDVPLGAFLSGGVDSSAVVALMSGLTDSPVKTSSIGFDDTKFNELAYAKKVVKKYQTDHYQQIVKADAVNLLEKLVWHYDEPFADSSAIPTYLVSKITKERVTVALSGDGGDENFAGYRRYYFDLLENNIRQKIPAFLRGTVIKVLAQTYPKADWLPRVFRAKTLLTNLTMSPMEAYYNSMSWFGPFKNSILSPELQSSLGQYSSAELFSIHGDQCDSQDPLSTIQYVDMKTYMVDDILTKVDRASMANSLEVRVPLLDHEFMELVATIPSSLKLKGKQGKYLLKKSLEPLLPNSILYRPKMGFSIPLATWLRTDLKSLFEDTVLTPDPSISQYIHSATIKKMWEKHQSGLNNFASELWAILFFATWSKRFL